jgi:galactoside O-acetyltransferase
MNLSTEGKNIKIYPTAKIIDSHVVSIGNNVIIDDFVFLMGGKKTVLGNYVHIASFTSITGGGIFTMGDFSGLSSGVRIFTGHEDYTGGALLNPTVPQPYRKIDRTFVHIGKHAVVGANSVVLSGVTIGEGCAIGACSLVLRDCDPWWIYAGVPAQKLKRRPKEEILRLEKELLGDN